MEGFSGKVTKMSGMNPLIVVWYLEYTTLLVLEKIVFQNGEFSQKSQKVLVLRTVSSDKVLRTWSFLDFGRTWVLRNISAGVKFWNRVAVPELNARGHFHRTPHFEKRISAKHAMIGTQESRGRSMCSFQTFWAPFPWRPTFFSKSPHHCKSRKYSPNRDIEGLTCWGGGPPGEN